MKTPNQPPVICLMGPTASGKTGLAMALHESLPVDIISVDSSQVYRGMDIGTAKPGPQELARAPHRLIDIRDPSEPYSAADFRDDAVREIEAIHRAGRIPLLVGGTMFYFHALEQGLSDLPPAHPETRARLAREAAQAGWPSLHQRLANLDPPSSIRIKPNDAQRIQRALEILEVTGRPASSFAIPAGGASPSYDFIKLVVCPPERHTLHRQIATRFQDMLDRGLVAETEALARRPELTPDLPAMRAVGYRQVLGYLSGALSYQEMTEKGIIDTRQLAKRQLTWLRAVQTAHWLDSHDARLMALALDYLSARVHL